MLEAFDAGTLGAVAAGIGADLAAEVGTDKFQVDLQALHDYYYKVYNLWEGMNHYARNLPNDPYSAQCIATSGVREAWSITKGAGVKVGVIDTGVDASIPDLKGAVVDGKSFSGSGNGQTPADGNNHGTNVGSLIAGRGHGSDHGSGILGTAPAA